VKVDRLLWYARRARTMERGELRFRLRDAVGRAAEFARWCMQGARDSSPGPTPFRFRFCRNPEPMLPEFAWNLSRVQESSARILLGSYPALGYPWQWRPDPTVWHCAPDTGRLWPRKYSDFIDHRSGNSVGDVRVLWEPNRLQQLIELALLTRTNVAAAETAAQLMERQLGSWLTANPPCIGVNNTSAMEAALRILSVCVASDIARPYFTGNVTFWTAAARLVLHHAEYVVSRLSLFSSLGNHTIAECNGLFLASVLFPEHEKAETWEKAARKALGLAAARVVMPDGGPGEQALHYHAQVLDHLEIAVRIGNHFGRDMSDIEAVHSKGARFLAAFGTSRDSLPRIGDDDGGHAISAHFIPSWATTKARPRAPIVPPPLEYLSAGGYSVVRSHLDGVELIFDHGPLGMPPNFGHGHADALSIHLRVANRPLLLDPGTYTYANKAWRSYFRSTAAHNTVTVDGRNQAEEKGAFLWAHPHSGELIHVSPDASISISLVARHDGYRTLGVTHWRAVHVSRGLVLIVDQLRGKGTHHLALRWHFPPGLVERQGSYWVATATGVRVKMAGGEPRLFHGSEIPISGWDSKVYGTKEPISTVELTSDSALPHEFVTTFLFAEEEPAADIAQTLSQLIESASRQKLS
jgi:hypothetical protein